MKNVEVIKPVSKAVVNEFGSTVICKKRVCAYARVSTDYEDQINSYKTQIDEYTNRIKNNPAWEFIGMFADLGISGTSMKKRVEFMKMITLARSGAIDLILVKSISRFARNTVDILSLVRELRNIGCVIYFEKENIYSDDSKIDFILTVLSSIAQEESRSISSNVKWSIDKRFKSGNVIVGRIYGFDKDEKGNLIVNPKQAEIVKLIYSLFIQGFNINDIVKTLNNKGITHTSDKELWCYSSVRGILTNEKYSGDAILQKTITKDYLTHKAIKNDNIAPKYLIRNNHEAIISRDEYDLVQNIMNASKNSRSNIVTKYSLTNLVYCSSCKRNMRRHLINHNRKSETTILDCNHASGDNYHTCSLGRLSYEFVESSIIDTIKDFSKDSELKEFLFSKLDTLIDTSTYQDKIKDYQVELTNSSLTEEERNVIISKINFAKETISQKIKSSVILSTMKGILNTPDMVYESSLIKLLFTIVIANCKELILVVTKGISTSALVPLIDDLKKLQPFYEKLFINYEMNSMLNVKVVYYGD